MNTIEKTLKQEVAALEHVLDNHSNQYYTSATMLGKKWYGIGLEDNESANQKDDTNKKGIIRRMLDTILAFIGRIVTKVKEFFVGKKKDHEQTEKIFKEYNGPDDQTMASAFSEFVHSAAKDEEHTSELKRKLAEDEKKHQEHMTRSQKEHDEFMKRAEESNKKFKEMADKMAKDADASNKLTKDITELFKRTGKEATLDELEKYATDALVERFFMSHRYQTTTWFVMTMRDDFIKSFTDATEQYDKLVEILKKGDQPTVGDGKFLNEALDVCFKMQQDHRLTEKKDLIETVTKLVNGDSDLNEYIDVYLKNSSERVREMEAAYNKAKTKFDSMKDTATMDEVVAYRDAVTGIGKYLTMYSNVSNWAHTTARVLKPGGWNGTTKATA